MRNRMSTNILPYDNSQNLITERMRKRRCFADKELETATLGLLTKEKAREVSMYNSTFNFSRGNPSSISVLRYLFPSTNSNILELVLDGCHGNLSRALQHLNLEILHHNQKHIASVSFSHFNLSGSSLQVNDVVCPLKITSSNKSTDHDKETEISVRGQYSVCYHQHEHRPEFTNDKEFSEKHVSNCQAAHNYSSRPTISNLKFSIASIIGE